MKVHLLTACTRTYNLPRMAQSIEKGTPTGVEVVWHIIFDRNRESEAGQSIKNAMIDTIEDGWVYILDDDNLLHPRLLERVAEVGVGKGAVVVSQLLAGKYVRVAKSDNARVGKIDAAQAVLRRSFIGDARLPETYDGDGKWLEGLLRASGEVVYVDEAISYYNALR